MAFGDDDFAMMLDDAFSVPVKFGAQRTTGILDKADDIVPGADGSAFSIRTTTLHIKAGSLTSLTVDSTITVDSVDYNITDIAKDKDGKPVALTLVE